MGESGDCVGVVVEDEVVGLVEGLGEGVGVGVTDVEVDEEPAGTI